MFNNYYRKITSQVNLLHFLTFFWAMAVSFGLMSVYDYANTPGRALTPPNKWPTKSHIEKPSTLHHLIVFVHPQCPCTRATIQELMKIMSRSGEKLHASVLFFKPGSVDEEWAIGKYWNTVLKIPHTTPLFDHDGAEAILFNATTSGQTLLYNSEGNLLFSGGITASRGHEGPNLGEQTILSIIYEKECKTASTPFFGCPLFKELTRNSSSVGKYGKNESLATRN